MLIPQPCDRMHDVGWAGPVRGGPRELFGQYRLSFAPAQPIIAGLCGNAGSNELPMRSVGMRQLIWLMCTLPSAGCSLQRAALEDTPAVCADRLSVAQATQIAGEVLGEMHFSIEKLDPEQGVVRTRPLRGAQFFEAWRRDNAGAFSAAEASLHTIRRSVEVRIEERQGRRCIDCVARVQRLSLPEQQIASTAQAYRMYSRSSPSMQRFELEPEQRAEMAWMDLGRDTRLAREIVQRMARKIERLEVR